MKTEEAKKNIQETLSKLESFNRDSDPVFSSLLQVLSSLIIVIISAFETLQTSFNQLQKNHSELNKSFKQLTKINQKIAHKKKRSRKHVGRQKVVKAMLQLESSRFTLTITATN